MRAILDRALLYLPKVVFRGIWQMLLIFCCFIFYLCQVASENENGDKSEDSVIFEVDRMFSNEV